MVRIPDSFRAYSATIVILLAMGLAGFVVFAWIETHHLMTNSRYWLQETLLICIGFGIVSGALGGWWYSRSGQPIPIWYVFALVILGSFTLFNSQLVLIPSLFSQPTIIQEVGWFPANGRFLVLIFSTGGAFLIIALGSIAIGAPMFETVSRRFPSLRLPTSLRLPVESVIGLFLWMSSLLLLSHLKLLTPQSLWIILGVIAWWQRRLIIALIRKGLCLRLTLPTRDLFAWVTVSFLVFLIALNLNETLRPAPSGYDDTTYYYDQVRQIAIHQTISKSAPAPFEVIAASMSLVTREDDQRFALSLGAYGLFFGTLLVYLFGRTALGQSVGLGAACLFLSIPMGPALAFFETKPDSLLLPVLTLASWCLWEYWRSRSLAFLGLSFFLLGVGITIKLTALFFLPAWITIILWHGIKESFSLKRIIMIGALALPLLSLPFLPWKLHAWGVALAPPPTTSVPSLTSLVYQTIKPLTCTPTGDSEDLSRFAPDRPNRFLAFVTLPWNLTLNPLGFFATEIGVFFLAVLPLTFILFLSKPSLVARLMTDQATPLFLVILITTTLIAWYIGGKYIPWYSYPVLAPLALLSVWLLRAVRHVSPWIAVMVLTLFFLSLFGHTLVRMQFAGSEPLLRYSSRAESATTYLNRVMPGYEPIMRILNEQPRSRMWFTNSRFWYGITDNAEHAYLDHHLDTFACLLKTQGPRGVVRVWQELNVRYILFNKGLLQELRSSDQPTYREKIQQFVDFSAEYLRPVSGSPYVLLFEIAP